MTTAYDSHGDQSPDAAPADRGLGAIPPPAALKPIQRGRGEGYTITGVILIVISFICATLPSFGLAPVLTWLGLFLAGVLCLCTGSMIRAILDAGKATK